MSPRIKACVFLAGVNKQKSGNLLDELNNAYLKGIDNYPTSVESAMKMLSLRADSKYKKKPPAKNIQLVNAPSHDGDSDGDDDSSSASSFSQSYKSGKTRKTYWHSKGGIETLRCKRCGGRGHKADKCPSPQVGVSSMMLDERNAFLLDNDE